MDDYELSKDDFEIIERALSYPEYWLGDNPVKLMNARELRERFRNAHTARIIYE